MTSFKKIWLSLFALCLMGVLLLSAACPKQETNVAAPAVEGAGMITVTQVSVPEDNQVLISGNAAIEGYPTFLDNPLRVIVDIRNAGPAPGLPTEITGKGLITKVEVVVLGNLKPPVVRIIAYVSQDVTYDFRPKGTNAAVLILKPRVTKPAEKPSASAPAGGPSYEEARRDVEKIISGEPPTTTHIVATTPTTTKPATEPASGLSTLLPSLPQANPDGSATVVGDIFYRTHGSGIQIMIYTNGTVKDYKTTESGLSLIIDLPGLAPVTPKREYPIQWGGVKVVRVSGDKSGTRVVILFSTRKNYQINKTTTGVVITIP